MEFKRRYHEMFTDYVARRDRLRRHRGRQNQQRQPGSDRTGTLNLNPWNDLIDVA